MPDRVRSQTQIKTRLPRWGVALIRSTQSAIRSAQARGTAVWCPVCQRSFARFLPMRGRPAAMCPGCGSLERHRQIWTFVSARLPPPGGAPVRLLHIAPEWQISKRLRRHPLIDYVSADLYGRDAMLRLDVTSTGLADESFDAIICSHVLEHVDDDRAAIAELLRILRAGGWAVLETPIDWTRESTFEDPAITDPAGRRAAFGQWDHVRVYGRDFPDLLAAAGWTVQLTGPNAASSAAGGQLVHCRKPDAPRGAR